MNIRVLCNKLDNRAGSHVYHRELAGRLESRGHRVSLICLEAPPEGHGFSEVIEARPHEFENFKYVWNLTSWLRYRYCTRWLLALDLEPADIVIGAEHLFLKAYRRRYPKTPLIYLPHSLVMDREISSYGLPWAMHLVSLGVYQHLQRWALDHAEVTLRFTQKACDALVHHYGSSVRPRFIVNPMGVDVVDVPPAWSDGDEVRLLSVGRLVPSKGLSTVIEALPALRHFRWRLDIVGDGPSRAELERRAGVLGLGGRVHFHGFCPDPSEWYRRASLLLFPSKTESLGLVLLEAMGHGVPCLAIRADWIDYWNVNEEIIDHGRSGLIADGERDFSRLLESVLRAPEQLIALGCGARRKVVECHTWDGHLDRYETLFEELLSRRRGAVYG